MTFNGILYKVVTKRRLLSLNRPEVFKWFQYSDVSEIQKRMSCDEAVSVSSVQCQWKVFFCGDPVEMQKSCQRDDIHPGKIAELVNDIFAMKRLPASYCRDGLLLVQRQYAVVLQISYCNGKIQAHSSCGRASARCRWILIFDWEVIGDSAKPIGYD